MLDGARYVPRDELLAGRPNAVGARFEGLWVVGSIAGLGLRTVAVVGSRAPSEAGRRLGFEAGRTLGEAGVCVLSGLALGIDGAAHEGAVAAGAPTIGVLGGGHRHFHPRRNVRLAERMLERGGAVLSPFPPDHPAYPAQFLQRNGVVAALADAVVIVEAAARSGALNTASWAADLGVPVFAFPGDVDRLKVAGCLALIRDGATLVRSGADVLGDLGIVTSVTLPQRRSQAPADPLQAAVLRALRDGEASVDGLLDATGAPVSEVLAAIALLEVAGRIERRAGQRFASLENARTGDGPSRGR
jgi:DNA processing protein